MSRKNRTALAGCAILSLVLALAAASRAAEPLQTDQAVQITDDVCKALVRGDGQPLLELARDSDVLQKLGQALKDSPRALHADPDVLTMERDAALKQTCNILAQDFVAATCAQLPAREGKEGPNITARFERGRNKVYLLFRYRVGEKGPALLAIDFPLLGADLVLLTMQQSRYGAVLPDAPAPAKQIAPWRKHLASVLRWGVVILLFGYLIFRRNRAARAGRPYALRTAFLVPLGLLVLFVMMLGLLYQVQWKAPQPASTLIQDVSPADKLRGGSDFPDVERRARAALKYAPDNLSVRIALANALMVQGRYAEAKPLLQTMADRDECTLYADRQLAIIATQANDYPEAIRRLNALLDGLGEDEGALLDLARIQLSADNSAEAEKALTRALAVAPKSFGALEMRARILIRRNDMDGAAADLRAIRTFYNRPPDYFSKDADFKKLKGAEKYADIFAASPPASE
jgi:tetratricopeptide (TPR) repeat protein